MTRWTVEHANEWYEAQKWLVGCNYLPRTPVNMTEMWQAETFDIKTIDQELGWASQAGYNSVRVFLQYLVWTEDAEGLRTRIEQFLTITSKHGISTMLILFCDCSFAGVEPYLGKQDDPVAGVHNSGWVPSPGLDLVTDKSVFPALEKYVKDIAGFFSTDERVVIWDLYNEPGNSGMDEKSLPLVEATFAWAREVDAVQPLTIGAWTDLDSRMSRRIMELSDIVSFHDYTPAETLASRIETCQTYGRPVICTEFLHRQSGNTFEAILPLFSRHKVGWYQWGLVAGRTQTYMPWGSKPGDRIPSIWQHDVLQEDGTPYDSRELALVHSFRFKD